jgi:hypothetical protein
MGAGGKPRSAGYAEVTVNICSDGSVVMTLGGSPPRTGPSFIFAMHNRDLASLLDHKGK